MSETEQIPYTVGNFQLQSQLAGASGQGITLSGYIYHNEAEADINARLDLYMRVIDRRQKISEIPMLEAKLQGMRDGVTQHQIMLAQTEEKEKQGIRLPTSEKNNITNLRVNMKHFLDQIAQGEQALEKLRQEVK